MDVVGSVSVRGFVVVAVGPRFAGFVEVAVGLRISAVVVIVLVVVVDAEDAPVALREVVFVAVFRFGFCACCPPALGTCSRY